jgi:hypothetical protein
MPFCRRCGTKLEEEARFCHKCGTPVFVATYPAPPPPQTAYKPSQMKPWHKDTLVVATISLVSILVVAVVAAALSTAPLGKWDLSESLEDKTEGVKNVSLNFQTNVGQIIIFTQEMGNNNIGIYIQANGSRGLFGNHDNPVNITFDNQTVGDVLTVNSAVHVEDAVTSRAKVQCMIYVNPSLILDLNVSSTIGQVSFTGNQNATIQNLNLLAVTGEVETNLDACVIVAGNVSLSTTTGAVNYRMSQTFIVDNCTANLRSVTGEVNMDITQTKTLDGNLVVNSEATIGGINLGLTIDSGVGARISSDTGGFGEIHTDLNNFNSNDDLVQSANYPSASNIEIYNKIHAFGSVYIQASYLTTTVAS